jgi:DNA-directed RNA polymerase subunit RPC12/RpoP
VKVPKDYAQCRPVTCHKCGQRLEPTYVGVVDGWLTWEEIPCPGCGSRVRYQLKPMEEK